MEKKSLRTINQIREMVEQEKALTNARFIRPKQGAELYNMSRTTFSKIASESGALYKIGGTVLVNKDAFEKYLETYKVPVSDMLGV